MNYKSVIEASADCMCGRKHKHSRNTTECPWKKLSILTYHFSPLFFATFIRRKYDEVMKDRWKMQRCFIFHLWKNYFSFLLSALKLLTFNFSRVYDTQTGRVYVCLQRIVVMGRLGQTFIERHILLFFSALLLVFLVLGCSLIIVHLSRHDRQPCRSCTSFLTSQIIRLIVHNPFRFQAHLYRPSGLALHLKGLNKLRVESSDEEARSAPSCLHLSACPASSPLNDVSSSRDAGLLL